ncbi:ubiquinol-cytochrome c reductase iron-sulfur subunit [Gulosibacter sediminis]|uniref:QcrA and Rieske domain-containing protein n=1 Tax=Gulosibacter sediminis TaxID=1729695 RepID=UPI0024A86878|nr:Rieske (2Fe-2S) protein [Gulosibacter sediminis]
MTTDAAPTGLMSRRALVRTTAVAGGGVALAALLSACGESSGEAGETTAPFTVPASEVPIGGGIVLAQHQALVTQPVEGEFHAFSAVCTHKGCVLSDVQGDRAHCGCHNSYFDLVTGEPVAGPALEPLPELTVTQDGDELSIS